MKMLCNKDKQELNITIKPVVAATCKAGTPKLKSIGNIINPPPIPTIVANIPAITDDISSFTAILGVITNYLLSSI